MADSPDRIDPYEQVLRDLRVQREQIDQTIQLLERLPARPRSCRWITRTSFEPSIVHCEPL